jgi:hypothetical protein
VNETSNLVHDNQVLSFEDKLLSHINVKLASGKKVGDVRNFKQYMAIVTAMV